MAKRSNPTTTVLRPGKEVRQTPSDIHPTSSKLELTRTRPPRKDVSCDPSLACPPLGFASDRWKRVGASRVSHPFAPAVAGGEREAVSRNPAGRGDPGDQSGAL